MYHYVLVCSLFRIITQPRLSWWPKIDYIYSKSSELRIMFTDTLIKATQGCISHTPLRMIQVFSLLLGLDDSTLAYSLHSTTIYHFSFLTMLTKSSVRFVVLSTCCPLTH